MLNSERDQNHSQNSETLYDLTSKSKVEDVLTVAYHDNYEASDGAARASAFDGTKSLLVNRSMTFRTESPSFQMAFCV
jgi:hypothetical protein